MIEFLKHSRVKKPLQWIGGIGCLSIAFLAFATHNYADAKVLVAGAKARGFGSALALSSTHGDPEPMVALMKGAALATDWEFADALEAEARLLPNMQNM